MKVRKKNSNWMPAVCLAAAFVPISLPSPMSAQAQRPKPVERAGRIHGFGWGDGYHVCKESELRLGADLPPKSFTPGHRLSNLVPPTQFVRRAGATFYDRFDACNRPCDAPNRPCDAPAVCRDSGCDRAPNTIIHGSQVIQGARAANQPQVPDRVAPQATIASPPPTSAAPQPGPAIEIPSLPIADSKPEMESATAMLADPIPPVESVKKRPIRPEPPEFITPRSIAITAPAKNSTPGFGLASMGIPDSILNANRSAPDSEVSQHPPGATLTPGPIRPIHPHDAKSLVVSQPDVADKNQTRETLMPDARGQAGVPSYAITPPLEAPVSPIADKPLPQRLGSKSSIDAEPQPTKIVHRPSRLGFGSLKLNPSFPRPVVEIADRADVSGDEGDVIYQPGMRR